MQRLDRAGRASGYVGYRRRMSTDDFAGDLSARVREAQAKVAETANCSLDDALALMTSDGDLSDESLEQVAEEVLSGRLHFGPPQ